MVARPEQRVLQIDSKVTSPAGGAVRRPTTQDAQDAENGPDGGVSGREWALQDPIRGPVHLDRVLGRRKLAAQLPPAAIQRGQSSRARLGHKRAARGGDAI